MTMREREGWLGGAGGEWLPCVDPCIRIGLVGGHAKQKGKGGREGGVGALETAPSFVSLLALLCILV